MPLRVPCADDKAPKDDSTPCVSVVAMCYNQARFVIECLESIRAKTFDDFELIITDDASTDASRSLIEGWIAEHGIRCTFITHSRNLGLMPTLIDAVSQRRGRYLTVVCTDDVLMVGGVGPPDTA